MKVKFTKLAALLLAGAALLASGCTDYEKDIQEANARIDQLNGNIADANQQISALQAAVNELKNTHSADIKKLNETISALETALKADIDKANSEIQKLKEADETFKAQIADLAANKADKDDLEKVRTQLTTLITGEIARLEGKIADNEAAIAKINDETIPAINEQIKKLQEGLAETNETVKLLNDAVEELAATCATKQELQDAVDNIMKKLDDYVLKTDLEETLKAYATKAELKEVKDALDGRLKALEAALKGFEGEGAVKNYIDGEIAKINSAIEAINGAIAAIDLRVEALENGLEAANENITALQEAVEEINGTLDEIKNSLMSVKAAIRSLVFVPEVYVDGVEAILIQTLNYKTQTLTDKDTADEIAEESEEGVTVSPKVIAKYHVIPSNADLSFLADGDTVDFVIRPNDPFKTIRTRAEASEDFNVIGVYRGLDEAEPDVICIEVTVEGTAATDDMISVVALQLNKDDEMYTSDYACIFSEELKDLRIAMPADEDYHYRRALMGISELDEEAGIPDYETYIDTLVIESCDTVLVVDEVIKNEADTVYEAQMNLLEITESHVIAVLEGAETEECEVIDPAKLGLDWKFELVDIEDWELGAIDEITLQDDTLIVAGVNAMDLTPVVRAYLVNEDEENAQIAYIKFYVAPQDFESEMDMGQFTFSCEGDSLEVEVNVYEEFGMSKETFLRVYPEFKTSLEEEEGNDNDPTQGEADDEEEGGVDEATFDPETGILKWKADAEWLWHNAVDEDKAPGEALEKEVYFVNPNNGAVFTVTLKALPAVIQAYKITTDHYIEEYWDTELTYARYNVAVPMAGEKDSTLCVFHNNINAAFETVDATGVIDLSDVGMEGLEVSNIKYFFCDDMEEIVKVGPYDVTFTIEDGEGTRIDVNGVEFDVTGTNTILKAKIDTVEAEIAYICNTSDEKKKTPNVVVLVKDPDPNHIAKKLLNTNEFYVLLGATGEICGDEGFKVNLLWQSEPIDKPEGEWLDHFRANYIQPVYVTDRSKDDFTDAVDFGQDGSFITLKDLIAPYDWREDPNFPSGHREFGMNEGDQYYNYWDYYGVFKISVDTTAITCNLTSDGRVPVTLDLQVMDKETLLNHVNTDEPLRDAEGNIVKDEEGNVITLGAYIEGIDDGGFGFLTYRNNGTAVKEFYLNVPVMVQYGWGIITTDEPIKVKVNSTIG